MVVDVQYLEGAQGLDTRLFGLARNIVRFVEEREKPNGDRLPEYTEARLASFQRQLYSPSPIYKDAEKVKLADSLAYMVEKLGADHAIVKQVLAGKSPEARAAELVDGTTLADVAARKALVEGGTGRRHGLAGSAREARDRHRPAEPRGAEAVGGPGRERRPGRLREDRAGRVRDAGHQRLPRRHRHAAALVRPGEGLRGGRQDRSRRTRTSRGCTFVPTSSSASTRSTCPRAGRPGSPRST